MNRPLVAIEIGTTVPELSVVIPTFNERDNIPLLCRKLDSALAGRKWEAIFVDDNSPDGTIAALRDIGAHDGRIRAIRRVGRRGLAGACIEGMLAAQAPVVAILDADLQHDETILPVMLRRIEAGADIVVGTRYAAGGDAASFSWTRGTMSRLATEISHRVLKVESTDPMSGFFMLRRSLVEAIAPRLSGQGFKILLDILATAGPETKLAEVPYSFGERQNGESKLDNRVLVDFLGLLVSKASGGLVPVRFAMFAMVGVAGIVVHLATLRTAMAVGDPFNTAQIIATIVAMTSNFFLNNMLTYRDRRLSGFALLPGLLKFYAVCGFGAVGNVGVGGWVFHWMARWWVAGLAGSLVGATWNYLLTAALIWPGQG